MRQIKVSIIMPVYNGEKFLQQTMDSIVKQTYGNYELIVVNDGSTDTSKSIIEKYLSVIPNMCILDQKNSGVSVARNNGLSVAKGEYVCFVDADDWLHPDFLRIMVGVLQTYGADVVVCEYEPFYDIEQLNRNVISEQVVKLVELSKQYKEQTFDYIMQLGLGTALWNKVFKTEVIRNYKIYFDANSTFGEDMFFNWKFFLVSHHVMYVKHKLYGYRQNIHGATFKYHPHLYESYKQEYVKLSDFAIENGVYSEQLQISMKKNLAKRIPSFLRMNQRRKASIYSKYQYVKELIEKKDIYEAAEVMGEAEYKQSQWNKRLYTGILQHKTFQVFGYGFYAEYRFRIGRIINYLWK